MKNSDYSIFINKYFDYQLLNGPKVTMEFQVIAYPNKDNKTWGYSVEPVDIAEIEVLGFSLGMIITEAFEAELKQYTRLSQLLEGTGIRVEADINNNSDASEEANNNH